MAIFEYSGQLPSGSAISGTLEAEGADVAKSQLTSMGIQHAAIAEQGRMLPMRPLSRDDLQFFNQQLASLAQTGIALDKGLRILASDLRKGRLQRVVSQLADDIERGVPFEDAVEKHKGLFPPLYAEILRSGVKNNQLGSTLCNLNAHMTLMQTTRRLFWESAAYPIIVLLVALGVMTIFMTLVVPEYESLIGDFAGMQFWTSSWSLATYDIPTSTQILFALADVWPQVLFGIAIVVLGSLLAFFVLGFFGIGRRLRETIIMLLPGFWGAYLASLLARFCQAAALSATAGHDLPAVLRLAAGATGHRGLIRDADNLSRRIESGDAVTEASKDSHLIPAIVGYTAQIAGMRGQLAPALAEMARGYDALARHRVAMLRLLLTPLLILVTAAVLGLGVFGILGPMFRVTNGLTG